MNVNISCQCRCRRCMLCDGLAVFDAVLFVSLVAFFPLQFAGTYAGFNLTIFVILPHLLTWEDEILLGITRATLDAFQQWVCIR